MFAVRLIILTFLVAYSWAMGQSPANELNAFGKFISLLFFLVAPALYLLPTFEAALRRHPNVTSITLLNLFLGWTLVGWVVAIVWAFKKPEAAPTTALEAPADAVSPPRATKTCPYCAEEIMAAAIKCKHCGSQLSAA